MKLPKDDKKLLEVIRARLFTAVVGDILDRLGFTHQYLPPDIVPLERSMVLAGRALTVKLEKVEDASDRDYGLLFQALDDLKPGEVFTAGGAIGDCAVWGELMTARALKLRAAGAVLDGPGRDTRGVLKRRFPVFCRGSYGQDQAGRAKAAAYRVPLQIGQARIEDGDLLLGDADGVLAIPKQVEREALERAFEKVSAENTLLKDLQKGLPAVEAFRKHGIF